MAVEDARLTPPDHLSDSSKRLYRELAENYRLDREPHALKTLLLACEALDRCEQARQAVAEHGMTYVDRFGAPRSRPEVAVERDARLAAIRALRELSLDAELAG